MVYSTTWSCWRNARGLLSRSPRTRVENNDMGAKKQLAILLLVIVAAALFAARPTGVLPRQSFQPFRLSGLTVRMADEEVEALLGKELPSSLCPEGTVHHHEYQDSQGQRVSVTFDTNFCADEITGNPLELRDSKSGAWVKILQVGDSEKALEALPELVPLNLPNEEVYLRRGATLRHEGIDLISYSYWDPKGRGIRDSFDVQIQVQCKAERISTISLRWMGH